MEKVVDPVFPNIINGVIKARIKGLMAQVDESKQIEHAPTKGALREKYLTEFLESLLPSRYLVKNGFICDVLGGISPQLDLILADTSVLPSITLSKDLSLIPVEVAIGAVEVKSVLKSKDVDQLKRQVDVILLLRPVAESDQPGHHGVRIFIFAYESGVSMPHLAKWFESIPALFGICIMGKAFIRRAPEGIITVLDRGEDGDVIFISSLIHAVVKAGEERLSPSLNVWRRYIVGVDPSVAAGQ